MGPYLNKEDLLKLFNWKITRGKFRPLINQVKKNDENPVQEHTRQAFQFVDKHPSNIKGAIEAMSKDLKGIGPATASAILAAHRPDLFPFYADEPVLAFLGSKPAGGIPYTVSAYVKFQDAMVKKAQLLGGGITAEDVARALWCADIAETYGR